jgi:mRNA (guanine-N7-)-methyltransferase
MDSNVAQHYNNRKEVGTAARQQSPIYHLKNFNNWIKAILINKYANRDDHVLDLCCGKGGDLLKWKKALIGFMLACDIAQVSVEQAEDRYRGGNAQFKAEFHAVDCFSVVVFDTG